MEKLKTLLDRVYELEGLVQLALSRNDDAKMRIAQLIAAKGEAVSVALADYEQSVNPADSEAPEGPNPLAEAEDLISYSLEEEEEEETPETETETEPKEEPQEAPKGPQGESWSGDAGEARVPEAAPAPPTDPQLRRLRSLFSINDRFRFARELFGGSTRRFDDSLTYLDGAIDFNEVEDFFISEQGMDPESPVVKEFLDIISRSFGD